MLSVTLHFSHFVWIHHKSFFWVWHIAQSNFLSVVVSQCWRLVASRWPVLVTKAGLFMGFSGVAVGQQAVPYSSQVSVGSLYWEFRTMGDCLELWGWWRNDFFDHFHIWQLAAVSPSVTFISTTHVVILILYNGWLQGIYAVINVKLPSSGRLWKCVSMCTSSLSFQTITGMLPVVVTLMSLFSIFSVLIAKLPGILLWFGVTVPQKFILFFVRLLIYVRRRNGTVHILLVTCFTVKWFIMSKSFPQYISTSYV